MLFQRKSKGVSSASIDEGICGLNGADDLKVSAKKQ